MQQIMRFAGRLREAAVLGLMGALMASASGSTAHAAPASQRVLTGRFGGNIILQPRDTFSSDALVSVKLLQSFRDLAPITIASQKTIVTGAIASLTYELTYDPSLIDPDGLYYIDALITEGDDIRYITTGDTYALTRGYPLNSLNVVVRGIRPVTDFTPAVVTSPTRTMWGVLTADPRFKTMRALAEDAGLAEALDSGDAQMTLFAPTDDAFARLSGRTMEALKANKDLLRKTILYHLLRTRLTAADVSKAASLNTMLEGHIMQVAMRNGAAVLDAHGRISRVEIAARNGNVLALSELLIPPEVQDAIPKQTG